MIGVTKDSNLMARKYLPTPKSATFTKKLDGRFLITGVSGSLSKHFDQTEHMKREKSMLDLFNHGDEIHFAQERRRLLDIESKVYANTKRRALEYKSARLIQKVGLAYVERRRQYLANILTQFFQVLYNRKTLIVAATAHKTITTFLTKVIWRRRHLRRVITNNLWTEMAGLALDRASQYIIEEQHRREQEALAAEALRIETERLALQRERARAMAANANKGLGLKLPLNGKSNQKVPGYMRQYGSRSRPGSGAGNRRGFNNSNNGLSTARSAGFTARSGSRPNSTETARRRDSLTSMQSGERSVAFTVDWNDTGDLTASLAETGSEIVASNNDETRRLSKISLEGSSDIKNAIQFSKGIVDDKGAIREDNDSVSDINEENDEQEIRKSEADAKQRLKQLLRERAQIIQKANQAVLERARILQLQKEEENRMREEQKLLKREDILGRMIRRELLTAHLKKRRRPGSPSLATSLKRPVNVDSKAFEVMSVYNPAISLPSSPLANLPRTQSSNSATLAEAPVMDGSGEVVESNAINVSENILTCAPIAPQLSRHIKRFKLFESRSDKDEAARAAEQARQKSEELAKVTKEILNKCKKRPIELKPVVTPTSSRGSHGSVSNRQLNSRHPSEDHLSKEQQLSHSHSDESTSSSADTLSREKVDDDQDGKSSAPSLRPVLVRSKQKHAQIKALNQTQSDVHTGTKAKLSSKRNDPTLKAPSALPEVRVTRNHTEQVDSIMHELLSSRKQTSSDSIYGMKDISNNNTIECATQTMSAQELADPSALHEAQHKNKNTAIIRLKRYPNKIPKSTMTTSPYHPDYRKHSSPTRIVDDIVHSSSQPVLSAAVSTTLSGSSSATSIVSIGANDDPSAQEHLLNVDPKEIPVSDTVVKESSITAANQPCITAKAASAMRIKLIPSKKKPAKSPKPKKKSQVQELLEIVRLARARLNLPEPTTAHTHGDGEHIDDAIGTASNIDKTNGADNVPESESSVRKDIENTSINSPRIVDPQSAEDEEILLMLLKERDNEQSVPPDDSEYSRLLTSRPGSAFKHSRLPSPYTAARISARINLTVNDDNENENGNTADGTKNDNRECTHTSSIAVPTAVEETPYRSHTGKRQTAFTAGQHRLGPPPAMSFLVPTGNPSSPKRPPQVVDSDRNLAVNVDNNQQSRQIQIDHLFDSSSSPEVLIRPFDKEEESHDIFEQQSKPNSPQINETTDANLDLKVYLTSSSVYSQLSYRFSDTSCDDDVDGDHDYDIGTGSQNSIFAPTFCYDYIPTSSEAVTSEKIGASITSLNHPRKSPIHMKKAPQQQNDELQKIKYDIDEKLLKLDSFM